jgi:hypothetical protein
VINTYFAPLTVSPTPATPGGLATVSGSLCTQKVNDGANASLTTGAPVVVTIGFPTPIVLNTTGAPTTGNWSVQFTVPPGTTTGSYPITAGCADPVPYPNALLTIGATAAFTG